MLDRPIINRADRVDHESADDYHTIVVILNAKWRVIECRDRIQWILQVRDGERSGRPRWAGRRYCRTRDALIRDCRAKAGRCDASAMVKLEALPARLT